MNLYPSGYSARGGTFFQSHEHAAITRHLDTPHQHVQQTEENTATLPELNKFDSLGTIDSNRSTVGSSLRTLSSPQISVYGSLLEGVHTPSGFPKSENVSTGNKTLAAALFWAALDRKLTSHSTWLYLVLVLAKREEVLIRFRRN